MLRNVFYYAQLVLESAPGVFGVRIYEEPRYAVLAALRERVAIRRYAPRLAAQTEVAGTAVEARNAAFRILLAYIAGGNVVGEKIAMTTPVGSAPDAGGVRMRFFLPARYTATTAPRPTDAQVRLVPIPDETMGILRFSGSRADGGLARRWRGRRGGRSGSR
jgi:hypothetical protein